MKPLTPEPPAAIRCAVDLACREGLHRIDTCRQRPVSIEQKQPVKVVGHQDIRKRLCVAGIVFSCHCLNSDAREKELTEYWMATKCRRCDVVDLVATTEPAFAEFFCDEFEPARIGLSWEIVQIYENGRPLGRAPTGGLLQAGSYTVRIVPRESILMFLPGAALTTCSRILASSPGFMPVNQISGECCKRSRSCVRVRGQ